MDNLKAVILAAGEGTRMKSKKPKVLHKVMNKTMVERVIQAAKDIGANDIAVIVGHKAEEVKAALSTDEIKFLFRKSSWEQDMQLCRLKNLLMKTAT